MSINAELFCSAHKLRATHICKLSGCAQRLLCEGCFSEPHAAQHSHSIASVNEFLFSQNKRRVEMGAQLEKRLGEADALLAVYEAELRQSQKAIDADLGLLFQSFVEIINTANGYLKGQILKDYNELAAQQAALRRQLAALQAQLAQGEAADFVLNFGKEAVEPSVERLVAKNAEVNQAEAELGAFLAQLRRSMDNRIVYKINRQSQELYETMQALFSEMCFGFFRNFRMLLVRPVLEGSFLSQFERLKAKLLREREQLRNPHKERPRDGAAAASLSFSDIRQLLTAPHDLSPAEPRPLVLPPHVAGVLAHFVEFRPQGVQHPTFDKLAARPSTLMEDGTVYDGQWDPQTGARHGLGRALFPDGAFYHGFWLYGRPSIVGRFVYADGELFEGILSRGKPNGRGTLLDLKGYKYEGLFQDGMRHGAGVEQTAAQAAYRGDFFHNLHQGFGVLTNPDGTVYTGEFFEGKYSGKGRFVWPSGEEYDGDWFEDKKHGCGVYRYQDGRVYEGDFVDDLPHGYGVLTLASGTSVKAFWNRGEPTGLGLKTDKDTKASLVFDQSDSHIRDADLSLVA